MGVASRRRREREERRFCILKAAESVFADKGFVRATMDDIAAEAELSKGTLYLYFKNKDDLLMALASRSIGLVVEKFERLARSDLSGVEALQAMLRCQAKHLIDRPQMFRIMTGQLIERVHLDTATPSFEQHRAQIGRIISFFTAVIERGKRDGTLRSDIEPAQTSAQLWGGLIGTLLLRLHGEQVIAKLPQAVELSRFVDGYVELVCRGLQPANAES